MDDPCFQSPNSHSFNEPRILCSLNEILLSMTHSPYILCVLASSFTHTYDPQFHEPKPRSIANFHWPLARTGTNNQEWHDNNGHKCMVILGSSLLHMSNTSSLLIEYECKQYMAYPYLFHS